MKFLFRISHRYENAKKSYKRQCEGLPTRAGKIERLASSAMTTAGPRIASALSRKSPSPLRGLSIFMRSAIPDVATHVIVRKTGNVSQNPSGFPAYTATVVKRAVVRSSPLSDLRINGLVRVTRICQRLFRKSGDLMKTKSRNEAPQRNIASWRAFRSYQSSMLNLTLHPDLSRHQLRQQCIPLGYEGARFMQIKEDASHQWAYRRFERFR